MEEFLLIGVLGDQSVNIDIYGEGQCAHLEQVDKIVLMGAELVENDYVLNEVEIEVRALLLCPSLAEMKQKDRLAAVEIKSEDAVNAHQ